MRLLLAIALTMAAPSTLVAQSQTFGVVRITTIGTPPPVPRRAIVFVHRISEDDRSAWTNGRFYWPEALSRDRAFADAEVLTVNYPSSKRDRTSSLVDIAGRANYALWESGLFRDRGPRLTFIAHSMGGLVVRRILSQLAVGNNAVEHVLDRVDAVVYLATPHAGAGLGTWLSDLGGFADLGAVGANHLLAEYEYQWSLALIDTDSLKHPVPQIACGIEGRPLVPVAPLVVDSASARSTICSEQWIAKFPLDHNAMSQPTSVDDTLYKWVVGAVQPHPRLVLDCSQGPRSVIVPDPQPDYLGKSVPCSGVARWMLSHGRVPWAMLTGAGQ